MSLDAYLLYLGVLAAFFATPPDTSQLLVMSHSLRHGLRKSCATIAGDLSANALQMALAALGLTAIIAANAEILSVIKWLGVAYLGWIGLRLLRTRDAAQTPAGGAQGRLFRQGFLTSSANPYAVIFFAALFPQFIDAGQPVVPQVLVLGVTYLVVDGGILLAWGWAARRTMGRIRVSGIWINRVCGALMIAAAGLLGLKDLSPQGPR